MPDFAPVHSTRPGQAQPTRSDRPVKNEQLRIYWNNVNHDQKTRIHYVKIVIRYSWLIIGRDYYLDIDRDLERKESIFRI